ncbi:MAG: hypothetical protein QOE51_21, partial [Actinoplanes sp.]|nr:hypothetical protein [Actinoplanes sp.]
MTPLLEDANADEVTAPVVVTAL